MRPHPVTGWKTLSVNENFTKEIVGLEKRFSDGFLDSLNRTIAEACEYQVVWKWAGKAGPSGTIGQHSILEYRYSIAVRYSSSHQ